MPNKPYAVVTMGGTKEWIDGVRYITNFSSGKFGHAIVRALVVKGFRVTALSAQEAPILDGGLIDGVEYAYFDSTESLKTLLLSQESPDVIFHAAAVSDYKPEPVEGKISSDQDELILRLTRTAKILPLLRDHFGSQTFIVGFKLLVNETRNRLVEVALKQTLSAQLDLTVANDLSRLGGSTHPVILVTPEGGSINIEGNRQDVANNLVEFVTKQMDVTMYSFVPAEFEELAGVAITDFHEALQTSQLLGGDYDKQGAVSTKYGDKIVISPDKADLSSLWASEGCIAKVDHEKCRVEAQKGMEVSRKTPVHDMVYRIFPSVETLIHFERPWGKADYITSFPYPSGCIEQGSDLVKMLRFEDTSQGFSVELLHQGFLLALPKGGLEKLYELADTNFEEFKVFDQHIKDHHDADFIYKSRVLPIFDGITWVGSVLEHPNGAVLHVWKAYRGRSLGKAVVKQLIARQMQVQVCNECNVLDFYRKFGFTEEQDAETGLYTLSPPPYVGTDELFDRVTGWKVTQYSEFFTRTR